MATEVNLVTYTKTLGMNWSMLTGRIGRIGQQEKITGSIIKQTIGAYMSQMVS